MNFLEAAQALLDYVRRPEDELLTRAKFEINAACAWANRNYNFKFAEELTRYTCPANSTIVNLTDSAGNPKIVSLFSAQMLGGSIDTFGVPLRIMQYQELQEWNKNVTDNNTVCTSGQQPIYGLDQIITENNPYVVYLMGQSLGVYPTPISNLYLLLHYNKMLAPLVNDSDTNFLLTYCYDFVISKAMMRMMMFLKDSEASLVSVVASQVNVEWDSCKRWDSLLRYGNSNERPY